MALRCLNSEHREKIIEMFMMAELIEKGSYFCVQCKQKTIQKFNPVFLTYYHLSMCPACETKLANIAGNQRIVDKAEAFERFKEEHEMVMDAMQQKSGVPFVFRDANKDNLGKATADALRIDQSYFITGSVGVGKSHMAAALIRMYIEKIAPQYDEDKKKYSINIDRIEPPIFIEVPELLLRIRDSYHSQSTETEMDIVDSFTQTPYLVLDDLGAEKASDFSTLMLYLIINRRCTSGRITVITSNLTLPMIQANLSERISSRIKGMCREITVAGDDKRYENDVRSSDNTSATH